MDEVFYLEPDEEITSVIDKIKQSKANRLNLVVPKEATLLQSVVNLKLLVKETQKAKKEIALVTTDKIGRNLAAQVGLTVYETLKSPRPVFQPPAPEQSSQEVIEIDLTSPPKKEEPKPQGVQVHHFQEEDRSFIKKREIAPSSKPAWQKDKPRRQVEWVKLRKLLYPAIGMVVLLGLIGALLYFPKTTVKFQVKAENYQKSLEIQVAGDATANNLETKTFAGELIDISQEKEEKFPATGKKNLGGKAGGTLALYNYWDSSPQNLSLGAKFSSSEKTFLAKSEATIPGTSIKGGNIVPGTTTVEIEAENPGDEYNVKAGRFTIVGLSAAQQEKIYGQSNKDLTGGFTKEVTVISQADYDQAKGKLTNELNASLDQELKEKASSNEIIETAVQKETIEEKSSAGVDSEANDFTLKIKQRIRLIVFEKTAFDEFILQLLEKELPYDKMITLGPNDRIANQVLQANYDQSRLKLRTEVLSKISSRVDTEKVHQDLLGKSSSEAEEYLKNLGGVLGAKISFSPNWWLKRISNFENNLQVQLEYVEEDPSPSPTPHLSPSAILSPQVEVTE